MREQLRGFGADADEFRRIFRARDVYDQQLAALTGSDAATAQRRNELIRMRDEAVKQAVGPERFALYQMTENPLFRQAQEQAQQNGAPPEKVIPIFRINQAVQEEITRLQSDRTLTEDQRRVALAAVQQQQRNSIDRILANAPADQPPGSAGPVSVPIPAPISVRQPAGPIVLPPVPAGAISQ
jgi:hypothetical protein